METGKVVEDLFRLAFFNCVEPGLEKLRSLNKDREDMLERLRKVCESGESLKKEIREFEGILEGVHSAKMNREKGEIVFTQGFGQVWIDDEKERVEKKIEIAKKMQERYEEILGVNIKVSEDFNTFLFLEGGYVCLGTMPYYWVEKVEPEVEGIQEMVQILNETEDLQGFLKSLRDQFTNLTEQKL